MRQLLVDGVDPCSIELDELADDLKLPLHMEEAYVLSHPGALSPAACTTLRELVDRERSTGVDTVDGAADNQLNLSRERLESLIGVEAAQAALVDIPFAFCEREARMSAAADLRLGRLRTEIFVRRYTGNTRPWIPFHTDRAAITVNIALCADATHDGGRLLAARNGKVRPIERAEGEATVHDARLLHGVTRIVRGAKYSLIVFLGDKEVVIKSPSESPSQG